LLLNCAILVPMLLKDLILQLQELYDTSTIEPEIMVDEFKKSSVIQSYYQYTGFNKEIKIEKSSDGKYAIISSFKI